jgi:hypothetical protein
MGTVIDFNDTPGREMAKARNANPVRIELQQLDLRFDPRTEVSADAKYIVRWLVVWFLVVAPFVGAFIWLLIK